MSDPDGMEGERELADYEAPTRPNQLSRTRPLKIPPQPESAEYDVASVSVEAGEPLTVAQSLNGDTLRQLFRNHNFVPLWLGQLVSYLGDQFVLVALLAVITRLSGESHTLNTVLLAVSLAAPQVLFGLIGGVLVDKLDRQWTMIGSDLARALAMFSMLLVHQEPDRLWIFFPAIFVIGTAQALFYPARASALPAIVGKRDLAGANALLEVGFVVALIFGSGAAGLLVERFGEDVAFVFNGAAFIFSAVMIYLIQVPRRANLGEGSTTFRQVWRELRGGLVYIVRTRSMRYIMGLNVMVSGGLGAVILLVLEYLNKELKIGADGFGLVIAILGVGIVVGGVLIQRLSKYLPTNRLVALAILLQGIAISVFILRPVFELVLCFTALIGFSLIVARAVLSTLTQAIPPEEYRGRVQSAFNLISVAPMTAAIAIAGVLVSVLGREAVLVSFGLALLVTAWFAATMLRGIDDAIYSEA